MGQYCARTALVCCSNARGQFGIGICVPRGWGALWVVAAKAFGEVAYEGSGYR